MSGRLWCVRLLLLMVVSALVFSPLAVRGSSATARPIGWNHDPSSLTLPSSPVYPAVTVYRDARLFIAERSFEKSELLLSFANQDAAAIAMMAQRQDFVSSASHSSAYQETFDRCIGWLVIASERGNDVSYLLACVKNDHLVQQSALSQAVELMPEWSSEALKAARNHVAEVLLEAVELLEGGAGAESYAASIALVYPDVSRPTMQLAGVPPPPPSVVVISPLGATGSSSVAENSEAPSLSAPRILSMETDEHTVGFGGVVTIDCAIEAADIDDLSYSWWCSRGNLVASGTGATWTAPERAGSYEIKLTISDDGGGDTRSVEVLVEQEANGSGDEEYVDDGTGVEPETRAPASSSPEILALEISADHKYFDESMAGTYSILVSRTCTIQCVVEDAAGLDFSWSVAGGGNLEGSGDTVTLSVPATPGYVTVTVTTRNGNGDEDSQSVRIYVSTCTYCF
jgi:hypothetical protein